MASKGGIIGAGNLRYMRYYMPQTSAEANWNGGICRDLPPASIPSGYCYDSVDFNLEKPGLAYFRGPLKLIAQAFGGGSLTPTDWISAPRMNGTGYLFAQWSGHLYQVDPVIGGLSTNRGVMTPLPIDRPKVYSNEPGPNDILVVPSGNGTSAPWKITIVAGVPTPAGLGGSPPPGKLVVVHANRVVLAGTAANPNRIYFGPQPNTEATWDTSQHFIDTTYPVTALASVQGVLLVFSQNFCERIIGDQPPGEPNDNMSLQPLGGVGCTAPLTIQQWGANIIFANGKGVFVTNGAGFDSLTEKPNGTGISDFWKNVQVALYGNAVVGAVYNQKFYFISVNGGQAASLVCYLPTKSWWQISNMSFNWADSSQDIYGSDEVFHVGAYSAPGVPDTGHSDQILICSRLFQPLGTGVDDVSFVSGTLFPRLKTRMMGDGLGLKAYEHGHLTLSSPGNVRLGYIKGADLEQQGSDGLGFQVIESPLTSGASAGSLLVQRKRFTLNFDTQAVYMTVAKDGINPLTETQIAAIEVEVRDSTYGSSQMRCIREQYRRRAQKANVPSPHCNEGSLRQLRQRSRNPADLARSRRGRRGSGANGTNGTHWGNRGYRTGWADRANRTDRTDRAYGSHRRNRSDRRDRRNRSGRIRSSGRCDPPVRQSHRDQYRDVQLHDRHGHLQPVVLVPARARDLPRRKRRHPLGQGRPCRFGGRGLVSLVCLNGFERRLERPLQLGCDRHMSTPEHPKFHRPDPTKEHYDDSASGLGTPPTWLSRRGGGTSSGGTAGPPGVNGAPGTGVPTGGTPGQVLTKRSVTDYDTYWADDIDTDDDTGTGTTTGVSEFLANQYGQMPTTITPAVMYRVPYFNGNSRDIPPLPGQPSP